MNNLNLGLYFITNSTPYEKEEFLFRVESAIRGGVSIIQIREKERSTREYIELASAVHEITKKYNIPLIVDDRIDVAMAIDAEGVHLGQSDMPIDVARAILGKEKIIGATAKTVEQAKKAVAEGADYLGVGAIYKTKTKVKTVLTSTETLADICRAVDVPVNAIGGLNKDNIDILSGIGISGICIVSAIMESDNPQKTVEEIIIKEKELGIIN